ncbi:MAG: ABC transporter ATP-binding protein [Eggerthellaceae bacterium]
MEEKNGTGDTLLEVSHLDVSYSDVPALHDVSFSLRRGSCIGIVGASGSGKSTLAKAVDGLLGPFGSIDAGSILFDGEDLVHASAERLQQLRGARIGYVFQNPGASFPPIRRIGVQFDEAMAEHGELNADTANSLLMRTFDRLGLPDGERLLRAYPFELSGGMAQRVAIAMTIALQPDLIIADEPTSALDVTFQAQVVAELMDLRAQFGTSVMLISHNIGLVGYACDRVLVMHDGRIVEEADADELLEHPRDAYTKALINAVPSLDMEAAAPMGKEGRR